MPDRGSHTRARRPSTNKRIRSYPVDLGRGRLCFTGPSERLSDGRTDGCSGREARARRAPRTQTQPRMALLLDDAGDRAIVSGALPKASR